MSVKFEIADWKFEVDLQGMTVTPSEENRRDRKNSRRESQRKPVTRRNTTKNHEYRQQTAEEGEQKAWA